ncbi:MAG: SDR family oxidoreductase [Alistipes sp.]|jgi:short-subunit dehydrogenase|nr:SDR family oxidoreductase [Alistipes sp.]MBR5200445.1 SDR family oxidoreductase [Alistipes sp.]
MSDALVIGGANGIGLAIATLLAEDERFDNIHIVDRQTVASEFQHPKFRCHTFDLRSEDYSLFDTFTEVNTLIITAGFGRLAHFSDIDDEHIIDSFAVNSTAVIRIIRHFYDRMQSTEEFYCGVMGSIAGFMSSPLFAVYGATKAALKIFIESVNVELEMAGTTNRILNISPGSIKGTAFYNGANDLSITRQLGAEILTHLWAKDDLFIPQYDEIFKTVLERYHADFRAEGRHSYNYKMQSGRIK